MLKYILLSYLWHRPSTGYELKQALDGSTGYFWHAYHSQIYTTLRKMEDDGWIISHLENEEDDHITRRIYEITPVGKDMARQWQANPLTELPKLKEDLLVRIFFSGIRPVEEILAELRLHRRLHEQQLAVYRNLKIPREQYLQKPHPEIDMPLSYTLQSATLRFGIDFEKMYLDWLDALIEELEAD
jgi:DNA-binding PadR family transcriptional regulator